MNGWNGRRVSGWAGVSWVGVGWGFTVRSSTYCAVFTTWTLFCLVVRMMQQTSAYELSNIHYELHPQNERRGGVVVGAGGGGVSKTSGFSELYTIKAGLVALSK